MVEMRLVGLEGRLKRARFGKEEEDASLVLMLIPRGEAIGDDEIAIVGASKFVCDVFIFYFLKWLNWGYLFFFNIVGANRLYIEVRDNENSDVSMASFEN